MKGIVAGGVLLLVPTMAMAKDRAEPRVQALLECSSVASDADRLRCYDQSILPLKEALARGSMVLKEKKSPLALQGTVKESGRWGSSLWILLDTGDRWSVQPTKSRRDPPPPGSAVRLKRTLMGTYWISGPRWPESEAEFLGHEQ